MDKLTSRMRSLRLLLLVSLFGLAACSDEEEFITPVIAFTRPALYIAAPSTSETVGFVAWQAAGLAVTGAPKGWIAVVDPAGFVTVTSPADGGEDEEEAARSGNISLTAYSPTGNAATATLYVSRDEPEPLDAARSNCYVVTRGGKSYSFPVDRMGESDRSLAVASVGLVWQSPGRTVLYPQQAGEGRVSFYVPEEKGELTPGNALFAAYDRNGAVLWTWHVWVTTSEPRSVGGWMDRNLGAEHAAHASHTDILRSYGTYYQWGRMTPFVGPYAYNCASSADADMYGATTSSRVYLNYAETTAETGTVQYAVSHPLVYLLGNEESGYDWNRSHDDTLWTAAEKSLYDPCPKGWRLAADFTGWQVADDRSAGAAAFEEQFGWNLTNGSETLFFLGGGRRSWLNGLITNVNTSEVPKPWIGYYWTAKAGTDNRSEALYFNLDTDDAALSAFDPNLAARRAEGMQVRCIKEE
ncbi:FISUMP domain-containing protein [uncultured Alistipes sp.]|uniref:FISUMP domain-containing protein n=1 Tax=uncultured Alistipes sp. TaxID=538949 RepID=UPI0026098C04|nr:FISUMP domain-containing protein [uncultured Alistipes sp.]